MILRLRAEHRATFTILAVALPLGLGLALESRRSVPASAEMPRAEIAPAAPHDPPASDVSRLTGRQALRLRLWAADATGARVLELTPERDLELPDVLVYWAKEEMNELPMASILLGPLSGTQTRRFLLPREVHAGRLYLYSLGHQELVTSLGLEP